MMLSNATTYAFLRRQLRSSMQGAAVCLERTAVAAVIAPQQRPFAGGRFLALTAGFDGWLIPRGFGTNNRPLSAFVAISPLCSLSAPQSVSLVAVLSAAQWFLLQQKSCCSSAMFPKLQLTQSSSYSSCSLPSSHQVVLHCPDGPASILLSHLVACLFVLLARLKLASEIRDYVQKKEKIKSIRLEMLQFLLKAHRKRHRFDKHDRYAIEDYTGPGFAVLNKALRSGAARADVQQRIDAVVRAMSKSKLKIHKGTVYRGAKLPSTIQDTLRPGATFCDRAFLSSSTKKSKAFSSQEGATLFDIKSRTGVDVSSQSKNKHEAEVLFRPSTMFKVKSVEEKKDDLFGSITLVAMDELA